MMLSHFLPLSSFLSLLSDRQTGRCRGGGGGCVSEEVLVVDSGATD